MKVLVTLYVAALINASLLLAQEPPTTPGRALLLMVQEIPLPGVQGRIDHFTFDAKRKRIITAALGNNTVEVIDTFAGRDIQSIAGAGHVSLMEVTPTSGKGTLGARRSLRQARVRLDKTEHTTAARARGEAVSKLRKTGRMRTSA